MKEVIFYLIPLLPFGFALIVALIVLFTSSRLWHERYHVEHRRLLCDHCLTKK